MKKNNSFENKKIHKQYILLLIYNMIAFLTVYVILGVIVVGVVNNSFFQDISHELMLCKENNEEDLLIEKDRVFAKISNPRFMAIFYDANKEVINNAYSETIFSYLVEDYNFGDSRFNETKILEAKESDLFLLNNELGVVNQFEVTNLNQSEFNFMSLSFEINSSKAPQISYCKLLVMVNAEINTRNKIVQIYVIASALIVALGMIASLLLSSGAVKPIADSLNKQLTFVGDASHELKTPLSIVQSKLENILTKTDSTVVEVSEDIAISLKEISRLSKLTNDLLALARSDNDASNLEIEECNIQELVLETTDIFKQMAELEEKTFTIKTEEVNAFVDKTKITQLIIILLDNAIKYTNTKDSITVTLLKQTSDFSLEVSDTGIGITEETKKKIFERFYREDKARSRETGGNGLGLSIAKTIVLEHGGKIVVEHNNPKGTKFIVTIPCKLKKQ